MKRFFTNDVSLFIADILILFTCIGGLYLITLKADLPFKTSNINSKLIVSENLVNNKNVNVGDELISIDKLQFSFNDCHRQVITAGLGDGLTAKQPPDTGALPQKKFHISSTWNYICQKVSYRYDV